MIGTNADSLAPLLIHYLKGKYMSSPVEIFGTQNLHDDDGAVIDSMFVETSNPPDIRAAEEPLNLPAEVEPTKYTRMIDGFIVFTSTSNQPIQALPADKNRKNLTIRVYSQFATPNFNDCVFVADDLGKMSYLSGTSTNASPMMHGHFITIDDHTGPLFFAPGPNIQGPIMAMWTAVTI
jgi:hypothetical protein